MSTPVPAGKEVQAGPATVRPCLVGGVAALSVGAAAIHLAVVFEHFADYALYGVFFLVISWAQMIWLAVLLWRLSRLWLWLGIAGNAIVIAVYVASRTVGLPFGPDVHHAESVGALDVVSCVLEFGLMAGCAALLWRPSLADRPAARCGALARAPILLGAMYIMAGQHDGPQIGGGLTRWHSHLVTCVNGRQTIAGFGVRLRGGCNPATWQDSYTAQMLHVWVVPYPGGVFSDDLSTTATTAAAQAALAMR
ncbi:MAG: hypothetical protein ACRDOK_16900 [Streptosporangiaceae bacterium]